MALGWVHGEFEPRALRLVLEWAELHKAESADASPLAAWPLSRRASGAPHLSSLQRRTSTTGC